jgi:ribosomal RNA-processing protein 12
MPPALVRAGMVDAAALREGTEPSSPLGRIIAQASVALDALPFAHAVGEVLVVIAALVSALRARPAPDAPSAAEALLLPLVEKVAGLRTARGFEHKEAADGVLRAAMRALGPAVVLGALPLHLEPADRAAGREPRAFLLPLLAQPHPAPLAHFVGYFVPLSERMFDLQAAADAAGRAAEAKLWAVLIGQIWAGLPGYCAAAPDIAEVRAGHARVRSGR